MYTFHPFSFTVSCFQFHLLYSATKGDLTSISANAGGPSDAA